MTYINTSQHPVLRHWTRYSNARDAEGKRVKGTCALCATVHAGLYRTAYGMVCVRCYRNALVSTTCAHCGRRQVRAQPDDPEPCCAFCHVRQLVSVTRCARCGEMLKKVAQWADEGPICAKCYLRCRQGKRCFYCSRIRRSVAVHSMYGDGHPICHRCIYERLPRCGLCGRRFRQEHTDRAHSTCTKCRSGQRARERCLCGAWTRRSASDGSVRCINCEVKAEEVSRTRDRLLVGLRQAWTRQLFVEYCDALCALFRWAKPIPSMLRADFDIFAGLDRMFASPEGITETVVARVLGPPLFARKTRLLRWLNSRAFFAPSPLADREWALLPWKLKAAASCTSAPWVTDALASFQADLVGERDRYVRNHHKRTRAPLQAKSAFQNWRAAQRFLDSAAKASVLDLSGITQNHVDHHVALQGRPMSELGRFIRYLNRRTKRFKALKLPMPRRTSPAIRPLQADAFDALLAAMLRPETHLDLKYSLMTLFCLLFAQFPKTVVKLHQDSLRRIDDRWEFRPAKMWLEVPEPMAILLTRWHSSRRERTTMDATGSSSYVFPGRGGAAWASAPSLSAWLSARGLCSKQLFVSGFANLCRHGLVFASIARDAYGVNPATAVRYFSELHPTKAGIAARETRASSAKRRRSHST